MRRSRREQRWAAGLSRRDFIALSAASGAGILAGCATNPVSGRRQLMLMSEGEEVALDRKWAPHQFSADYGASQDGGLNAYVAGVGAAMADFTHRPAMPYSFRVINTPVVNGYTMPAGSVALGRGLILAMSDEAELAAVLGHEMGHVNARHAAERMSKNILMMAMVSGVAAYVENEREGYGDLAAGLGAIGAGALLARYSREDEREADALGMEYMTRAGHNPQGMVGLMDAFRGLEKERPGAVALLFATHPMSDERYRTAAQRVQTTYAAAAQRDLHRQRYMDRTAGLRAISSAIEQMQKGEAALACGKCDEAGGHFDAALRTAPDDYAALLLMAKCRLAQNRPGDALRYAEHASRVYPDEPQADHVVGICKERLRRYDGALQSFNRYEQRLPGNSRTLFFRARCLEGMGSRRAAAVEYQRYMAREPAGDLADYAARRLAEWGYAKP